MKTTRIFLISMMLSLLCLPIASKADDIDLYSGLGGDAGKPNVLLVLDTAANFDASATGHCTYSGESGSAAIPSLDGKLAGLEQCALYNVIRGLPTNENGTARINLGIMFYNATGLASYGCTDVSSKGGCIVRELTAMDTTGKGNFLNWIKSWAMTDIKSNSESTAQTMQEAWAYYAGGTGVSGRSYSAMKPASGCQKNFVIFIGNAYNTNGTPGDGGLATTSLKTLLNNAIDASAGLTTETKAAMKLEITAIPYAKNNACNTSSPYYSTPTHSESSGLYADEWTRFMYGSDLYSTLDGAQGITTYTIGALGASCKPDYPALLQSMADQGGGKYYPVNADVSSEIEQAILKILNEVQDTNSVFTSSSLPVSVNSQGTYLNQVFMGMFRPDKNASPRWLGNLKQYQFIKDINTGSLKLADGHAPTPQEAINSASKGFITPFAESFWTSKNALTEPDLSGGFWRNTPLVPNGRDTKFDLPDGGIVEKGGAAQQLRLSLLTDTYTADTGTTRRKMYTFCPSGIDCTYPQLLSASPFVISNAAITDSMLGTGARAITSITSATPVTATSTVAGTGGIAGTTVSITAFSKSGSIVTATVSATDLAKISAGTELLIATGVPKFDCNPCTVLAVNTVNNTYTYDAASGNATVPATPYTATILSTTIVITKATHGLRSTQKVTITNCTTLTALNGTIPTITAYTADTFTVTAPTVVGGTDTACRYTANTATVTAANHGFPDGDTIAIAGATPTGYNLTRTIKVTGTDTFTYQYDVAAPLAAYSGTGATATGSTTKTTLINWVRGEDNRGDEKGPGQTSAGTAITVRPSIHGDVLHSRPVVINYERGEGVVVFYGTNDGVFHAVNGKQTESIGSGADEVKAGGELWSFVPSEFYGKLRRLRDNSPALLMPSTPDGIIPTPRIKDYFVDGPTGSYQKVDANGATTAAYLYLTMRRGGRFIYALDVTNPTTPKVMWKKGCMGSPVVCDTGFSELGQTWSRPRVASVKGNTNPVLIFGAGYDPAEDSEPPLADAMGRGIFVLDAITGNLVWSASPTGASSATHMQVTGMNYSMPADITFMDKDRDGYIDRLYAVDLGGNVWRVDFEAAGGNSPSNWQVTKLAALGCNTGECNTSPTHVPVPRKFFFPPSIVSVGAIGALPAFDAVLVGTGDREHPLYSTATNSAYQVLNRFYMLKDMKIGKDSRNSTSTTGAGGTTITYTQPAAITESSLFNASTTTYQDSDSYKGFYITLGTGEKVVNAPLTVAGTTFFGTNTSKTPSNTSCETDLGTAKGYSVNPLTGTFGVTILDGGGFPPSPVAGITTVDGKQESFCIGCVTPPPKPGCDPTKERCTPCNSAVENCYKDKDGNKKLKRTYWYKK